MVANAAAMESQAKRSRLVDFTRAGGGPDSMLEESCRRDFALFQLVTAIGYAFGEARALLGEEHGDARPLHFEDGRGELVDDHRRQALRRLIEKDRPGIAGERARDAEHLLLAARHAAAAALQHGAERGKKDEELLHSPGRCADARRLASDFEVLGHREVGEDAPVLGHVAEPEPGNLVRRAPVDARALEADLARARLDEAHQRLERGRLAGAVAAEEGHDLASVDREVEPEQDLRASIAGAQ